MNATVFLSLVSAVKLARTEPGDRAVLKLVTATVAGSEVEAGGNEIKMKDRFNTVQMQ